MPSPSTALDLIKGAMRLIGAISASETPTPEEANDGLLSLNDLLETWSTESLSVYGSLNETFPTIALQPSYTVGAGGNWNTQRPQSIQSMYCTVLGTDFDIDPYSQQDYNSLALKTITSDIPERYLYVNDNPLGVIFLWPVPKSIVNITFMSARILIAVPNLATMIIYPPGYLLALKHQLAILIAPDYGCKISAEVAEVAKTAKANIKRANKARTPARFDSALLNDGPAIWQRGY